LNCEIEGYRIVTNYGSNIGIEKADIDFSTEFKLWKGVEASRRISLTRGVFWIFFGENGNGFIIKQKYGCGYCGFKNGVIIK